MENFCGWTAQLKSFLWLNIGVFLQESYCFESDTYVCSSFDDTSSHAKAREAHRKEVAKELAELGIEAE